MNPRIAGLLVFLIALALRVALLHTARFGGDEALFFRIGMDIVQGQHFPLLGTQITDGAGRLPGPAFLYLMALPLTVWRAPEAQYLFVEVGGALTVLVLWQAMRRPFGEKAAFITGVLIACSPWSALYADRTWNPNVMPLVVAVALLAALRVREGFEHPKQGASGLWVTALLPLLAVMPHFHMSAPVAWAGIFCLCAPRLANRQSIKFWLQRHRRHLMIGFVISGFLYVPLLINELQTGFGNTLSIFAETIGKQGGERHVFGFVYVPLYAFRFLTLDVTYHELSGYWGGPDELRCLRALVEGSAARPAHPLRFGALACSVALALVAVGTVLRNAIIQRRIGPFGWAFAAALVVNTGLMGLAAKQVFGHYVTNLYPFVVVVWAALFQRLQALPQRWPFTIAVAAAVVIALGGIEATLSVSRNVDAKIGLEVHRRATAVIVHDAEVAGLPQTEPVRLDFRGVRSSWFDWHIFSTRALGVPLHFSPGAGKRRYALTPQNVAAPHDAADPVQALDVGYAWLWRLR